MRITDLRATKGLRGFLFQYVWGAIVLVLAFAPLAVLNLIQFPSLILLPFSRRAFRRYNRFVALMIWGWWAWGIQQVIGVRIHTSGDTLPRRENAVVIANHQGMADILVILCIAMANGSITHTTWMAKDIIKYVPGLGWGMAFLDSIFLKRNWSRDAKNIRATFAKVTEHDVPIWLVSFPEGTRKTPEKLAASLAFAARHNKPAMKHLLLPRPRGFYASTSGLRDHIHAVYSMAIGYPGQAPTLIEIIRGNVPDVYVHLRRHPIETIPAERRACGDWLAEEFRAMDQWLEAFDQEHYDPNCAKL